MSSNFRLPEPSGLGGDEKFLAVETIFILFHFFFFHVFVIFVATVSLPFCLFLQTFPPISDLIDFARGVKLNT